MSNPSAQLAAHLASSKGLNPTAEWLTKFLSSQRPTTPFQSLVQTASFRLLASDITKALSPDACLPTDVSNPHIKQRKLSGPMPLQILGVEDISKSRWEQIEAIEAIERGEGTRGREIIRVTEDEDTTNEGTTRSKSGTHKLLLQDVQGTRIYGIECSKVEGIGLNMDVGTKLLLREAIVARGIVLLDNHCVRLLGGKIEAYHETWKKNRKTDLKRDIEERGA